MFFLLPALLILLKVTFPTLLVDIIDGFSFSFPPSFRRSLMTHLIFLTQVIYFYSFYFLFSYSSIIIACIRLVDIFDGFSFSFLLSFEEFANLFSLFFLLPQRVLFLFLIFLRGFTEIFDGFFFFPLSFRGFVRDVLWILSDNESSFSVFCIHTIFFFSLILFL